MNEINPPCILPDKQVRLILIALLSFFPLAGMSIDLIAPSLPAISHALSISTTFSKNLIAIFLLGCAIGNITVGFLSDAWGRRYLFIAGLTAYTIASFLPLFWPHPFILLISRLIQGVGIAAYSVILRGVISDILSGKRFLNIAVVFTTIWGLGPIIAPIIGGYLQMYFGWKANFLLLAILGFFATLVVSFVLPETHLNRHPLRFKKIFSDFRLIISHRVFIGLILIMGLAYSLLIVFNTLGPFIIQVELHYSPIFFGRMAFLMGISFFIGTLICRQIVKWWYPDTVLKLTIPSALIAIMIFTSFALYDSLHIYLIMLGSVTMALVCGLLYPASNAKGLSLFRHISGSASAIMNTTITIITTLTAYIASLLHLATAVPLFLIFFGLIALCFFINICFKITR